MFLNGHSRPVRIRWVAFAYVLDRWEADKRYFEREQQSWMREKEDFLSQAMEQERSVKLAHLHCTLAVIQCRDLLSRTADWLPAAKGLYCFTVLVCCRRYCCSIPTTVTWLAHQSTLTCDDDATDTSVLSIRPWLVDTDHHFSPICFSPSCLGMVAGIPPLHKVRKNRFCRRTHFVFSSKGNVDVMLTGAPEMM